MRKIILTLLAIAVIALGSVWAHQTMAQTTTAVLSDGMLVKSADSPQVYYIENNAKRPILSEEAFVSQGFRWADIQLVSSAVLNAYQTADEVSPSSPIILPGEYEYLPDLVPLTTRDLRLVNEGGKKVLRFTSMFWNSGGGPFELQVGETPPPNHQDHDHKHTLQRIVRDQGQFRDKVVGDFLWHDTHNHYHYDNFSESTLELIAPLQAVNEDSVSKVVQKITFCLRDDVGIDLSLPRAPGAKTYWGCDNTVQGVSVGWADKYGYTLPDQLVDVGDLPHGLYKFTFTVDPLDEFVEKRNDNNQSVVFLEINPATDEVKIMATGAPYATSDNRYPDGTLLKAMGEARVYVVNGNQKRWLPSAEVFVSYGHAWSSILDVPTGVLAAIPQDRFIKLTGDNAIYMINDHGYKRHIPTMEILRSYSPSHISTVNQTEFAYYQDTDLIKTPQSNDVYSITEQRYIGDYRGLNALGYNPTEVQVVNTTDLNHHSGQTAPVATPPPAKVQVFAENLSIPWDMVFLPDGDMLVTERTGTIRRLGQSPAVIDLPEVQHIGEGGLMGMALHPDFINNRLLYLYFTTEQDGSKNKIVRFRLDGNTLIQDKVILDNIPAAQYHDGGRLAFGPDGMLYATVGDATQPDLAQQRDSIAGSTLRLTPDGGIPSDNPFGTAVWSYGHRNAQGIAWDKFGRQWQTEHGRSGAQSGFDELNLIEKGANYGWPIAQGDQTGSGLTKPVRHSGAETTWAPAGLVYLHDRLFFAGLRGQSLYEVTFDPTGQISGFEQHFAGQYGRLRGVTVGPDGFLYVSTSNTDGRGSIRSGDDKILKIDPNQL